MLASTIILHAIRLDNDEYLNADFDHTDFAFQSTHDTVTPDRKRKFRPFPWIVKRRYWSPFIADRNNALVFRVHPFGTAMNAMNGWKVSSAAHE